MGIHSTRFQIGTLAKAAIFSMLSFGLLFSPANAQTPAAAPKAASNAAPAPSAQEISDAKAKGMVWVNLKTHIYHKDGAFYGTTKHGKFMSEDDATKAGFRAAKESGTSKKAPAGK